MAWHIVKFGEIDSNTKLTFAASCNLAVPGKKTNASEVLKFYCVWITNNTS